MKRRSCRPPFDLNGSRVGGLGLPIGFRMQYATPHTTLPDATPTTNGPGSHRSNRDKPRSRYAELRCRRLIGGRTGRACREESTSIIETVWVALDLRMKIRKSADACGGIFVMVCSPTTFGNNPITNGNKL